MTVTVIFMFRIVYTFNDKSYHLTFTTGRSFDYLCNLELEIPREMSRDGDLLPIRGFPSAREIPCYAVVWRALISSSSKFNTCVGTFVVDGTRGFIDLNSSQKISRHRWSQEWEASILRYQKEAWINDWRIVRIFLH